MNQFLRVKESSDTSEFCVRRQHPILLELGAELVQILRVHAHQIRQVIISQPASFCINTR